MIDFSDAIALGQIPDPLDGELITTPVEYELLNCTEKGLPRPTMPNAAAILRFDFEWSGVLSYNLRSVDPMFRTRPPIPVEWKGPRHVSDTDIGAIQIWFAQKYDGLTIEERHIKSAVVQVAMDHPIDVGRDWLTSLEWDGKPRIDRVIPDYFAGQDRRYTHLVGSKFLISAVARTLDPGSKVDTVLVLIGKQGIGKSRGLRALVPHEELFSDDLPPLGDKDSKMAVHGPMIQEIAELAAFRGREAPVLKAFVSRQFDRFRPPYGSRIEVFPRRCVFAGTTNESEFLQDETGNRRFWTVELHGNVDVDGIARDRDQLFAEAVVRYHKGEEWYLSDELDIARAANVQRQYERADPWLYVIAEYLTVPGREVVSAHSILAELEPEKSRRNAFVLRRVNACLSSLGWHSHRSREFGRAPMWYQPGECKVCGEEKKNPE